MGNSNPETQWVISEKAFSTAHTLVSPKCLSLREVLKAAPLICLSVCLSPSKSISSVYLMAQYIYPFGAAVNIY